MARDYGRSGLPMRWSRPLRWIQELGTLCINKILHLMTVTTSNESISTNTSKLRQECISTELAIMLSQRDLETLASMASLGWTITVTSIYLTGGEDRVRVTFGSKSSAISSPSTRH